MGQSLQKCIQAVCSIICFCPVKFVSDQESAYSEPWACRSKWGELRKYFDFNWKRSLKWPSWYANTYLFCHFHRLKIWERTARPRQGTAIAELRLDLKTFAWARSMQCTQCTAAAHSTKQVGVHTIRHTLPAKNILVRFPDWLESRRVGRGTWLRPSLLNICKPGLFLGPE